MGKFKRALFTERLSPVHVSLEMRQKLEQIAIEQNRTMSDIHREALSLFLSRCIGKTDKSISVVNK